MKKKKVLDHWKKKHQVVRKLNSTNHEINTNVTIKNQFLLNVLSEIQFTIRITNFKKIGLKILNQKNISLLYYTNLKLPNTENTTKFVLTSKINTTGGKITQHDA